MDAGDLRTGVTWTYVEYDPVEKMTRRLFQRSLEERRTKLIKSHKIRDLTFGVAQMTYPNLTEEDFEAFKNHFNAFDRDRNGLIEFLELCFVLDELGDKTPAADRRKYFDACDFDQIDGIDFGDFLKMMIKDDGDQHHLRSVSSSMWHKWSTRSALIERYQQLGTIQQVSFDIF